MFTRYTSPFITATGKAAIQRTLQQDEKFFKVTIGAEVPQAFASLKERKEKSIQIATNKAHFMLASTKKEKAKLIEEQTKLLAKKREN